MSRADTMVVLYHRASFSGGTIIQFDCAGRVVHSQPERPLVTGEVPGVQWPQPRPMQWTNGAVPLRGGALVAIPRWKDVPDGGTDWSTELFWIRPDAPLESTVISGQWKLFDTASGRGVLMGIDEPVPYVIVVPMEVLAGSEQSA